MTEYLLTLLQDPNAWAALGLLIVMEAVLGIDNLIFISILTNKLPEDQRVSARRIGIGAALVLRLGLLGTIAFIIRMTTPVFEPATMIFRSQFSHSLRVGLALS